MKVRTAGFTLVELLVVIAIIAVLVTLLIPSVQAARESARQTQCRNNLKQLALACLQYHEAQGMYPGYASEGPAGVEYRRPRRPTPSLLRGDLLEEGTWITQASPFMEETALYKVLADISMYKPRGLDRRNKLLEAVTTVVPSLHCPSRRDALTYPLHGSYVGTYGARGARTDYAMSGGSTSNSGRNLMVEATGIWEFGRRLTAKDITDGASKSYLVGEKAMDRKNYTNGLDLGDRSPIIADRQAQPFGAVNSYVRFAARLPGPDKLENCQSCHDFGGPHIKSWNVALLDGSVHAASYEMSLKIHRALATVRGAEKVDYALD